MPEKLTLEVKRSADLSEREYTEILKLCTGAYGRDYRPFMASFRDATHVLGRISGRLASHALWVTRRLQNAGLELWRTAYVEAVATDERYRRKGYASAVLRRLAVEITDYDIGGLCTGHSFDLYSKLGWRLWRGPLFIRTDKGTLATPEEKGVKILVLPKTPPLDLDASLSAEWREGELW
ncbi:MAG: GNAT family N-acetyltransferase [Dehalococcoidales bacterium]|nr:GNAT family N-acetyltransferase [Dehalococcoidales bacterium]